MKVEQRFNSRLVGHSEREAGTAICAPAIGVVTLSRSAVAQDSRHQYERFDLEPVWRTVTDDLPPLKVAVVRALGPPPANPKGPVPARPSIGVEDRLTVSAERG